MFSLSDGPRGDDFACGIVVVTHWRVPAVVIFELVIVGLLGGMSLWSFVLSTRVFLGV